MTQVFIRDGDASGLTELKLQKATTEQKTREQILNNIERLHALFVVRAFSDSAELVREDRER